jgi:hypothetical protein
MSALELSGQKISEPSLKERNHASKEKEPHSPPRSPKADTRTLSNRSCVESVVNQVLKILSHSDLSHEAILIPVHTSELANMSKDILQPICELECLNITQSILNMRVNDKLGKSQDLPAEVEGITKARLLSLLGSQGLDWLQIEVIVQMKVIQVLSVNQQVEHVVALTDDLKSSLNPIKLSELKELGLCKSLEKGSLTLRLGCMMVKLVQDPDFQKLLVGNSHLNRVALRASFLEPGRYKWNVIASTGGASSLIERFWGPVEVDCTDSFLIIKRLLTQYRLDSLWKGKLL